MSMLAVVLMQQRHSVAIQARPAPAHGCAPSVAAQLEGQVVEEEERSNWASALRTYMLKQCAYATVGNSRYPMPWEAPSVSRFHARR